MFSASWFDSGFLCQSTEARYFTYFYAKVDSACSPRRLLDVLHVPVNSDPEVVYAFGRISHIFNVKVNSYPWCLWTNFTHFRCEGGLGPEVDSRHSRSRSHMHFVPELLG